MEKRKSYQELLKEYTMTQIQSETEAIEWQTDLFLNGLLQERHVRQLRADIDEALDSKDKEAFIRLTDELKSLLDK